MNVQKRRMHGEKLAAGSVRMPKGEILKEHLLLRVKGCIFYGMWLVKKIVQKLYHKK